MDIDLNDFQFLSYPVGLISLQRLLRIAASAARASVDFLSLSLSLSAIATATKGPAKWLIFHIPAPASGEGKDLASLHPGMGL